MAFNGSDHRLFTGAVAGALLGAGVALLVAPKAGVALRKDIGDSLTAARDAAAQRYRAAAAQAGAARGRLERAASSIEHGARRVLRAAPPSGDEAGGRS
ncbi:MAG: YtxH domain-containing protein [Vicinamibacterales bacterium]